MQNLDFVFLEKQRFSYRWKHILCSALGWLALLAGFYLFFTAFSQTDDVSLGKQLFAAVLLFFASGVCALLVWLIKKKYASFYRKNINGVVVPQMFPDLHYSAETHIPFDALRQSEILLNFTDEKSEGYGLLSGLWNDVNFQLSYFQLFLRTRTRGKNKTTTETRPIFAGAVAIIYQKTPKTTALSGSVAVVQDIGEQFFGGMIGGFFQQLNAKTRKQELVKIQNAQFEKFYAVYADNAQQAELLLDNSICEWLIAQKNEKDKIEICFQPDKIYVIWKAQDASRVDELTEKVQTPINANTVRRNADIITQKLNALKELVDLLS